MRNLKLTIQYDGTAYHGWQTQENAITVQEVVERAIFMLTGAKSPVVGCSRTDTGVHARGQCVHFDFDGEIDCARLERSINGLTKRLIRIRDLEPCAPDFHSRYDALCRYYQYTIFTRPVALMRDFGWECGS